MSQVSGTLASNKKSQQQAEKNKSKFRTGEGPDSAPSSNQGKGMGQMKPKQAKYGKKPDKDGAGTGSKGQVHTAAYHRSGGQQN